MKSATLNRRSRRYSGLALLVAIPIGLLGGLIGLGGAEFRLPVLAGPLRYAVRQAITLNLAVSLLTIVASLLTRGQTLTFSGIELIVPEMLALISGAGVSAFLGAGLTRRLSEQRLGRISFVLLAAIGSTLIIEAFLPQATPALIPNVAIWRIMAGVLFGIAIGLVSSLLGVAGGELIIPTLIFAFGVDVKTAGTASLLVSLPTVMIGVGRYASQGAYTDREALQQTVVPMGLGSIIGALIGGLMVSIVPAAWLKVGLGIILNISAFRIFYGTREARDVQPQLHTHLR